MFSHINSEIFVPDGSTINTALQRTTHLAIGAHQDDLEIMAIGGILHCFKTNEAFFTGVVMTDGKSSPREGIYKNISNEEMMKTRYTEQKKAAFIGNYSAQIMLGYSSDQIKNQKNIDLKKDLIDIIKLTSPSILFTHNLADKHPTHIAVTLSVIHALREMEPKHLPAKVYGCEVWRNLDWMQDSDKVVFNCSEHINIQESLLGVFDSQISGGKRYDLATMGRRLANATFFEAHNVDQATQMAYAMDLTPLIKNKSIDISKYVCDHIDKFKQDVQNMINTIIKEN